MTGIVLSSVGDGVWSGGAVSVLAMVAFSFYRYVWKPQQDRMDAFSQRTETTLEKRLTKAEERIDSLEKEVEQCHADRRAEQEDNARLRLALIGAGIPIPESS